MDVFSAQKRDLEQKSGHSALILFSRRLDSEAKTKAWLGPRAVQRNRALADLLIRQARRIAAESGLPVFEIDETRQHGTTFGQRLADAYRQVFALGYSAAIAIGNDSPALSEMDWVGLRAALEAGKAILGPTRRGGAYLIGLQAASFDPTAFAALPWQSRHTYDALHGHLAEQGNLSLDSLPTLHDLNTRADIARFLEEMPGTQGIARLLADLLSPAPVYSRTPARKLGPPARPALQLRGPPGATSMA
jgi:uncharacterized protein